MYHHVYLFKLQHIVNVQTLSILKIIYSDHSQLNIHIYLVKLTLLMYQWLHIIHNIKALMLQVYMVNMKLIKIFNMFVFKKLIRIT